MKAQPGTQKMPLHLATDVADQQNKLAGYINAKASVARYVTALQNTDISGVNFKALPANLQSKLPEDPAVLLKRVNENLTTAKVHGQTWSNDIQPGLTAIPQGIINYDSQFQATIPIMLPLLQDLLTSPDPAKRKELVDLFNGLLTNIGEQKAAVMEEISRLKQFNTDVTKDHGNFSSANNTFAAIRQFELQNITALNSAVAALDQEISALNKLIIAESVAVGASAALVAGGGIALAATAATGVGAVVAGAVVAFGMIGVGVSAGFLISTIEKKQDALQKEAFDKLEVTQLTAQVQMLDTTEKALSALVLKSQQAIAGVQVILDTWATLEAKIQAVVNELMNSETNIGDVASLVDLSTAQSQWAQLHTFAERMQDFEQSLFANAPVKFNLKPIMVKLAA